MPASLSYASVILDQALDQPFDYAIPTDLQGRVEPGIRVLVKLRNQTRKGTVLALKEKPEVAQVKPISEILSETPPFTPDLFKLALWMSSYYVAPLRKVLKIVLPSPVRKGAKEKQQLFIKPLVSKPRLLELCEELRTKSPQQALILDVFLKHPQGLLLTELLEYAQTSKSPIDTLTKNQILSSTLTTIDRSPIGDQDYFQTSAKTLSDEQQDSLKKITQSLEQNTFETHLLYGVTGSGKTEVYLQAIEYALKLGKSALLLIPEISLTEQTIHRLRSRFLEKIAILHHRLSVGERLDTWKAIRNGTIKIAVGARSALFAPLNDLGLIIIDEEHEASYKQSEEAPCYHARDVAVMRAKLLGCTAVLGSATPSLESWHNAQTGKYTLSTLTKRPAGVKLPTVHIVDMPKEFEKAGGFTLFSDQLLKGIKTRLERGEQTLLFLNRRGYHSAQTCQLCSHVIKCPHCDISLTFHRNRNTLTCHLCDHMLSPPPRECPGCKSQEGLKYKGYGTEQVERSLHAILPEVRTLRLDADTTRHKGSVDTLLKQFRSGKADVLIGTQMIAKGLHFPLVTLVGVLNADTALHIPDFRSQEKTFQLLTQVAGRAGRSELGGEVIIQTALSHHSTIRNAADQDFSAFCSQELEERADFSYPPYVHLIKFTLIGEEATRVENEANRLRNSLLKTLPSTFELLPVIPCGHSKIKNNFRFQFLLKGKKKGAASGLLQTLIPNFHFSKGVRLHLDIDPISTYF